MSVFRIDIGSLRKPERLADGRLRADAHLTRVGVFEYRNADGSTRREYRPDAQVFSADAMASFADAPLTDDHPPELVTARNARQYQIGQLRGEPRRDGEHVAATIVVNDADVIAKMDAGKVQLSCGYECDLDATPGIAPNGERYDAIQTNIRGNHVALVDVGRAGPTARVRMDAATMVAPAALKENVMTEAEMKAAIEAANKRADVAETRATEAESKLAARNDAEKDAKIAALEAKLVEVTNAARDEKLRADAADKARTDAAAGAMVAARARIALEDKARAVLGSEFKADATDRELMAAVVKRVDGEDVSADASDEFVRGLFAGASKRHDAGGAALAGLRLAVETTAGRFDTAEIDEDAALRRMNADAANAWKTPATKTEEN